MASALFQMADRERRGQIDATRLEMALNHGNMGTQFGPQVCRLMINLFDRDGSKTMNQEEFRQLHDFITRWMLAFQQYDKDRSGSIDKKEFKQAMSNMGYNLSEQFLDFIMHRYDPHKGKRLSVADFILVCVTVQMLTAQFRPLDTRQNGTAAIPYEKFMEIAIQTLM